MRSNTYRNAMLNTGFVQHIAFLVAVTRVHCRLVTGIGTYLMRSLQRSTTHLHQFLSAIRKLQQNRHLEVPNAHCMKLLWLHSSPALVNSLLLVVRNSYNKLLRHASVLHALAFHLSGTKARAPVTFASTNCAFDMEHGCSVHRLECGMY